jgi:membrane-bound inhibitor of C-type lysozyme
MLRKPNRVVRVAVMGAGLVLIQAMAGCGSIGSLWPFGGGAAGAERGRVPANSTEFRCDGGKTFYVRYLDDGAAWVIFPDREVRLNKADSGSGRRFTNGIATLDIDGASASLADREGTAFVNCRIPAPA